MVLGVPVARSQQQSNGQTTPPILALPWPPASAASNGNAEDPNANPQVLAPDKRALTGAQDFSLGVPALTHSFWQPLFNSMLTLDTNPLATNHSSGLTTWTSLFGGIDFVRVVGLSDLAVNYFGGRLAVESDNAANLLS